MIRSHHEQSRLLFVSEIQQLVRGVCRRTTHMHFHRHISKHEMQALPDIALKIEFRAFRLHLVQ